MTAPTPEWSAAALALSSLNGCSHARGTRPRRLFCLAHVTTLAEQAFAAGQSAERARAIEVVHAEEELDGDPPDAIVAYFKDRHSAVLCLRAAVRITKSSIVGNLQAPR